MGTWPELRAEYPEQAIPYVHLSGTGSFTNIPQYSIQIISGEPSNRLEVLFDQSAKESPLYIRSEVPETKSETVINGRGFSTDFWGVQNNDEEERTNYWAPDGTLSASSPLECRS